MLGRAGRRFSKTGLLRQGIVDQAPWSVLHGAILPINSQKVCFRSGTRRFEVEPGNRLGVDGATL